MPRISLWADSENGGVHNADYRWFDRNISEMFTVGGSSAYVHKYSGTATNTGSTDASQPEYTNQSEKNIQDLLFLENRDRVYDPSIYRLRFIYNVQDTDFDLSQFGLFLSNGNLYITFHLNDMVNLIGRKLMSGDVLELPHLKEFDSLDDSVPVALKRFYVVQEGTRSSEGYSPTWWPHLWRVKCSPLVDSQEFKSLLKTVVGYSNVTGPQTYFTSNPLDFAANSGQIGSTPGNSITLESAVSNNQTLLDLNQSVVDQAEVEVAKSGYDTTPFWIPPMKDGDKMSTPLAPDASPEEKVHGYLTGDVVAPNSKPVTTATSFPGNPTVGQFVLRTDFVPNRMFRWDGRKWVKVQDVQRTSLTNGLGHTQRDSFINNQSTFTANDGSTVASKQSLNDILKPDH